METNISGMANRVITKVLPKTNTSITRIYNGSGQIVSKTVILGEGNKISKSTRSTVTSYYNGKARAVSSTINRGLGDFLEISGNKKLIAYI